jgi:hypothetical protein
MRLVEDVFAQNAIGAGGVIDPIGGAITSLSNVFGMTLNIILGVGWALVFAMAGLGIIKFILSKGEPKETAAAKSALTYVVVGAFIMLFFSTIRIILFGLTTANRDWTIANVTDFNRP